MKRETDAVVEADGGDNVRTAIAVVGRTASSSPITIDEPVGEDAARFCGTADADV